MTRLRHLPLLPGLALLSALAPGSAPACHAQGSPDGSVTATYAGCKVQARAYVDPSRWASSCYDVTILNPKEGTKRWEMTLGKQIKNQPELPRYPGGMSHMQSRLPYGKAKETSIEAPAGASPEVSDRVRRRAAARKWPLKRPQ